MNNFGKYFFFENDIKHFVSTLLEVANVNSKIYDKGK